MPPAPLRPPQLGLRLQPRDIALLRLVFHHRFVRSDHLHALLMPRTNRRVIQTRLQKLFAHAYVKRLFVPAILDGEHRPLTHSRQPIYTLDRRGARLLSEHENESGRTALDRWRPEVVSASTLAHHLVVTDCLVALQVACRSSPSVQFIRGEHEGILWAKLREHRQHHRIKQAIVPDGAFTLRYATGETMTFYLEVVRADVKGGNRRLLEKLRRYVELLRLEYFRDVFGHERVRAVLLATTSLVRAKNLARVAEKLIHGRRLFWFGTYQEKTADGRFASCFTPEQILTLPWHEATGDRQTLQPPTLPPMDSVAT